MNNPEPDPISWPSSFRRAIVTTPRDARPKRPSALCTLPNSDELEIVDRAVLRLWATSAAIQTITAMSGMLSQRTRREYLFGGALGSGSGNPPERFTD